MEATNAQPTTPRPVTPHAVPQTLPPQPAPQQETSHPTAPDTSVLPVMLRLGGKPCSQVLAGARGAEGIVEVVQAEGIKEVVHDEGIEEVVGAEDGSITLTMQARDCETHAPCFHVSHVQACQITISTSLGHAHRPRRMMLGVCVSG